MTLDWTKFEKEAQALGFANVAGVDEAGRGPLAGPVVAAAVIIPLNLDIEGIDDSKKLSDKSRREIFSKAVQHPHIQYGIGIVESQEIDRINILNATFLAMKKAVSALNSNPDLLLVDGNQSPKIEIPTWTIVKGDAKSKSIALASIIAKVTRDQIMERLDELMPHYRFRKHKGYPTPEHKLLIKEFGFSRYHRRSFRID